MKKMFKLLLVVSCMFFVLSMKNYSLALEPPRSTEENNCEHEFSYVEKMEGNKRITTATCTLCGTEIVMTVIMDSSITYVLNGGVNNPENPTSYNILGQEVVLKDPTREGYEFKGWYRESNFINKVTTLPYQEWYNGLLIHVNKDVSLYAKWEKIKIGKSNIVKLNKQKNGKLKFKIKKLNNVDGYEVLLSDKKSKKTKMITIKKTTQNIGKLKKENTYRLKVRAYKIDSSGKRVYGKYSNVKSVKFK